MFLWWLWEYIHTTGHVLMLLWIYRKLLCTEQWFPFQPHCKYRWALVFVPMRNNWAYSAWVLLCCSSCQPRPFVNISNVEVVEEFHVFTRTFQPCIKPRLQIWHRFLLSAAQVRYRGTSRGCESEGRREKAVARVDQQGEAVTMEYLFLSPLHSTVSTQHCQFTTQ